MVTSGESCVLLGSPLSSRLGAHKTLVLQISVHDEARVWSLARSYDARDILRRVKP